MAFYTNSIDSRATASPAFSFFNAISAFFDRVLSAQNRSAQVERLQDLSDSELADIGLRREDIVRHVYSDIYYV